MRRTSIKSRWSTPSHRYAGGWRLNPWINAVCSPLHARNEAGDSSTASIDPDCAAREQAGQTGSGAPQRRDNQEQRAAVRTWENEGGSLGPHLT